MNRFLTWGRERLDTTDDIQVILDCELPRQYSDLLASYFKSQSAANALQAVISFLELIPNNTRLQQAVGYTQRHYKELGRVRAIWAYLKKTIRKRITQEQRKKMHEASRDPAKECSFLTMLRFLQEARAVFRFNSGKGENQGEGRDEFLNSLENGYYWDAVQFSENTAAEHVPLLKAMAGCYLALNGARLCVATNLTKDEVRQAEASQGHRIVRCAQHKTATRYGAYEIVLSGGQYKFLELLSQMTPGEKCFGPLSPGNGNGAIFAAYNNYVQETSGRKAHFRLQYSRRAIETFKVLLQDLPADPLGAHAGARVTRFLAHGRDTSRRYYEHQIPEVTLSRFRACSTLVAAMAALELLRESRDIVAIDDPDVLG